MQAKLIGLVVAAFVVLLVMFSGVEQIEQGSIGIKTSLGANLKSDTQTLKPGLYFYNPFTTSIREIEVRTVTLPFNVEAFTKDTQGVTIDSALSIRINPNTVDQLYVKLGTDFERGNLGQLLTAQTNNSLKSIIASYSMDEMLKSRPMIPDQVVTHLRQSLGNVLTSMNLSSDTVVVDGFAIKDIKVDEEYEKAAEAKQRAVQDAERAKNETVRKQEEAKQAVIAAQAEADSTTAKAKAEAEAFRIKNEALAKSPRLIEYTLAEKWDGALPVMVSSDKATQIMDVSTLAGVIKNRPVRSEAEVEQ